MTTSNIYMLCKIFALQLLSNIQLATGTFIPQSSNYTAGDRREHCTNSRAWVPGSLARSDCIAAVDDLYHDAQRRDNQIYEFLSPGVKRKSRVPPMNTPRKYTVGK